jgi:hypothetical protein
MNVVVRGLMAAGMAVYAVMHVVQAASPPDGAPAWLVVMFALTALVALVLAGGLVLGSQRGEVWWEDGAAALAGASLVALVLAFTVGFLGVAEGDLRADTALVFVAELVTLASWLASRMAGRDTAEVSESVPHA